MSQNAEREVAEAELNKWEKLRPDLMSSDEELRKLIPPEDVDAHGTRHLSQLIADEAIKTQVYKYLTDIKPDETTDGVEPHSASNLFVTTKTSLSRLSQRSASGSSTLSSAKLKEKQRQAELTARAASMEKNQEMKKRKMELQHEEEEMKLTTELAVSEARTRAINEFERELNGQQLTETEEMMGQKQQSTEEIVHQMWQPTEQELALVRQTYRRGDGAPKTATC